MKDTSPAVTTRRRGRTAERPPVERIGSSAAELMSALEEAAAQAGQAISESARRRPYLTVGIAAAVGWLAGGRMARHMTALVLPLASRVALSTLLHDVTRALEQGDDPDAPAQRMNGAGETAAEDA